MIRRGVGMTAVTVALSLGVFTMSTLTRFIRLFADDQGAPEDV
jgi:hypothetical protein